MRYYLYLFDDVVEVEIRVSYDATYQPERISGPPEKCHPAESSMDLTGYEVMNIKFFCPECGADRQISPCDCGCSIPLITKRDLDIAYDAAKDSIIDACWEHFHEGCL
jgi:hypothetical protein